jgi:Tfp pilus assembly protein PilF
MEVESPFKPTAETAEATEVQPAPDPASVPDTPSAQPVFASETESAAAKIVRDERAERTEPQKPTVRRFPTAASLTERGIALFSQERFQESVDQFTKAIALDPSYKLALKHRAEAYGRLGRAEQEAADQRQLEAI